jgi:signal transduction histidine kinase
MYNNQIIFVIVDLKKEEEGKEQAIVSIKDTGNGISKEVLPKLFSKFTTSDSSSGTGLGLYICKNIIQAHGGKIWAENDPDGKGAIFRFTLPIAH